jgi:RNA polymerase sigma factor (TIGR02999 family)
VPQESSHFGTLVARAYPALRGIAALVLREHRDAQQLASGPTSVLHEALERVARQDESPRNESQLRGVTAIVLRRVMLDRRRRREAAKRGGGVQPEALFEQSAAQPRHAPTWPVGGRDAREALRASVAELHRSHPRACEAFLLVTLHGLAQATVAEILGVSLPTVERDLRFARAWIAARVLEEDLGDRRA